VAGSAARAVVAVVVAVGAVGQTGRSWRAVRTHCNVVVGTLDRAVAIAVAVERTDYQTVVGEPDPSDSQASHSRTVAVVGAADHCSNPPNSLGQLAHSKRKDC